MDKEYFAKAEKTELAGNLEEKISSWANAVNKNGLRTKWMKCYRMYYGRHWRSDPTYRDSEILHTGEDGELSALTANNFRNLIKHLLVLTTNQKPAYDPRATNSDDTSVTQTKLAKNILDYYTRDKRVGRYLKEAAEMALVFGKGFIKVTWDKAAGKEYGVEDYQDHRGEPAQKITYEGDAKLRTLDPFAFFTDQSLEDWSQVQWCITREWVNRYDVAARHPDQADMILRLPTKKDMTGFNYLSMQTLQETDLIPEYEFYHVRSPALPNGRYMTFYSRDIVTYDGGIPYDRLPVFRIVPGNFYGSTEGYTEAFDIMNLQQAQNVMLSSAYTNLSTFAVQNILIPDGCNITPLQLSKALQAIKYNPAAGEPKALQLCQSPPELYKMLDVLNTQMEVTFGINSTARGQVDEELSGKAMGLLQSMAIQYASGFQESYAELSEDVATFLLHLIKVFATTERMVAVAGKYNKSDMVKFTGQDLSDIDRVVVDLGNPLSKTLIGRVNLADTLLEHKMISNPQEYMNVVETGNLETLTESEMSKLSLVRSENEQLQDGQPQQAVVFEPHILHIKEHLALISRPEIKQNSQLLGMVLGHVQDHKMQYLSLANDPQSAQLYSIITGEPPPPPPPPPPPMMMGPNGPMPMPPPGMHPPPHNGPHNGPPHQMHPPQPHGEHPPLKGPGDMPGPQQGMPPDMHPQVPPPPPQPQEALQQALR